MEKIKFSDVFSEAFCKSYAESVAKMNGLMKKLKENRMTPLERAIIRELAGRFPFHQKEVEKAYNYFKSFDKTIACLEEAASGGIEVQALLNVYKNFDDFIKSKGEPKQISEELFLNKELCDAIRKLVIEHPFNLHQGILIMEGSKNYDRDVEIAGKLGDVGYDKDRIYEIITLINQ